MHDRRWIRAGVVAALAATAAVSLQGCGGTHHAHRATAVGTAQVGTHTMHFRLAAASSGPVVSQVPDEPIATMPSSISGVTLQLFLVQRSEPGAALIVFALKVSPQAASGSLGTDVGTALSFNGSRAGDAAITSVSDVGLLDPSGLKEYLPFMGNPSNDATCLCSVLNGQQFDRSSTATNYEAALVAAPPSSVKTVSVVTGMGTFANVPLGQ